MLESKLEKKKNKSFFKKVPKIDKDVKECIASIKGEINAIQKKIPKTRGRENDGLKKARKGLLAKLRKLEGLQENSTQIPPLTEIQRDFTKTNGHLLMKQSMENKKILNARFL